MSKHQSNDLGMGRGPGGAMMRGPAEKPKNFKGTLKRLLAYLAPDAWRFVAVFVLAIASTVFTIASPKIIGQAVDKVKDSFMARMVLDQLRSAQEKAREAINGQLATMQQAQAALSARAAAESRAAPAAAPGTKHDAPPVKPRSRAASSPVPDTGLASARMPSAESLRNLRSFMSLPLLAEAVDPETKAQLAQAIRGALASLPPENPALPDATSGLTLEHMEDAIRAIRATGGSIDWAGITAMVLWLFGLYLMAAAFMFATQWIMSSVAPKTVHRLRKAVDAKLGRLPLAYFDSHSHGDMLSRVTNDVDAISSTLQQSLAQAIISVVQLIGFIVMMLTISWALTLIVFATLPLYLLVTMLVAKKSQKYFGQQQKELGALSGHVAEMYGGHVIVKAFGQEEHSIRQFEAINDRLAAAGRRASFVSGVTFPAMHFVSNLGYVLISVVGGIWITGGRLSLGDIVAFIQYSRSFTQPIIQTANIATIIQSTLACAERVFEMLDETEESAEPVRSLMPRLPKGAVSIRNLAFRYREDSPLIEDLSLEVQAGHTIAIVGPTGAGKTTLVNLLMRFHESRSGSISVDGVASTDMTRADLRSLFGVVLEDTWLFNGSIRDNIAYGREGASEAEIIRAARAAHADHFIRTLPEGYDTVLNEAATNVSKGQEQLLAIARAVLANPAILIFDEATSSVDTRTEQLIQKAMTALMANRTSIVIAHRLSTIRDAETILVMDKGSIVEKGTHSELLARKGLYAGLYKAQLAGAET